MPWCSWVKLRFRNLLFDLRALYVSKCTWEQVGANICLRENVNTFFFFSWNNVHSKSKEWRECIDVKDDFGKWSTEGLQLDCIHTQAVL